MTTSKDLIANAYSAEQPCKWCGDKPHDFLSSLGDHCLWCGTRESHTWDECGARLLSAQKGM